jgi:hypothetical protein
MAHLVSFLPVPSIVDVIIRVFQKKVIPTDPLTKTAIVFVGLALNDEGRDATTITIEKKKTPEDNSIE